MTEIRHKITRFLTIPTPAGGHSKGEKKTISFPALGTPFSQTRSRELIRRGKNLFWRGLDLILPPRCPVSGKMVPKTGMVHADIWGKLDFTAPPFCARCGLRFEVPIEGDNLCPACYVAPPEFDRARSVFAYDEASRDMILGFKHGDQTFLIKSFLPWLDRAGADLRAGIDVIIPVPLHRWRLLRRRYNQAGILAKALAQTWGVAYLPEVLMRVKSTPSQGHMTTAQRADNVRGVFRVFDSGYVKGKNILLVDDVYTTGATVKACARVLARAGAARVDVLTLARVMREERVKARDEKMPDLFEE